MAFRALFRRLKSIRPRPALTAVLLFSVIFTVPGMQRAAVRAETGTRGGIVHPTLLQQLNAGLLARTPEERSFNKKVVRLVNEGKLPISLVQSTFMWARNRQPYPMVYFEFALRLRAKRAGISL